MRFLVVCLFSIALLVTTAPGFAQVDVDVELVLATDASNSMDRSERRQQIDGYANAFRDAVLIQTILSGPRGRIAVTYLEWNEEAYVMVPWTVIASEADALRFAEAIAGLPSYCGMGGTNITRALSRSAELLASNDYRGSRQVIDISGDGPNNSQVPPDGARDEIVAKGITINGLVLDLPGVSLADVTLVGSVPPISVRDYYARHVVGGDGAMVVTAKGMEDFDRALRFKLVREIASR
jgi:hypothetical protein